MFYQAVHVAPELLSFGATAWAIGGSIKYILDKPWDIESLLAMLDNHWRGALILAGLVCFRRVQIFINRIRKLAGMELEESLEQLREGDIIDLGDDK